MPCVCSQNSLGQALGFLCLRPPSKAPREQNLHVKEILSTHTHSQISNRNHDSRVPEGQKGTRREP